MKTVAILMILVATTAWAGECPEGQMPILVDEGSGKWKQECTKVTWTADTTIALSDLCQTYFTFDPKEDITAYELAHAMMFIDWYRSKGGMYWFYNQLEESDLGDNPAKRHFTWHGCDK